MFDWFKKKVKYKEFPLFVMWDILNSRNMFIFQDIKPYLFHICTKNIASFLEYCEDDKVKNPKVYVRSSLDEDKSICYFEGTKKDGCC